MHAVRRLRQEQKELKEQETDLEKTYMKEHGFIDVHPTGKGTAKDILTSREHACREGARKCPSWEGPEVKT